MKMLLLLLGSALMVEAGTLRVSKAGERAGPNTEVMRITLNRYSMVYHVEKEAILTEKDVKSAAVMKEREGMLAVRLTPEGAKKLSKAIEKLTKMVVAVKNKLIPVCFHLL